MRIGFTPFYERMLYEKKWLCFLIVGMGIISPFNLLATGEENSNVSPVFLIKAP
jgi:hypothetical protein